MVLVMILGVIMLSPVAAGVLALIGLVRFVLRRIYDAVMFNMIKCCARQPREDSWIAWKVAGPGVSRNFYQTIKE